MRRHGPMPPRTSAYDRVLVLVTTLIGLVMVGAGARDVALPAPPAFWAALRVPFEPPAQTITARPLAFTAHRELATQGWDRLPQPSQSGSSRASWNRRLLCRCQSAERSACGMG